MIISFFKLFIKYIIISTYSNARERERERGGEGETEREIEREIDRETDRQSDRQTDKETDREILYWQKVLTRKEWLLSARLTMIYIKIIEENISKLNLPTVTSYHG